MVVVLNFQVPWILISKAFYSLYVYIADQGTEMARPSFSAPCMHTNVVSIIRFACTPEQCRWS